jgi:hypothetical protein
MTFIKHLNGKSWKSVIEAKWWPNQRKAVELAGDYLDAKKDHQAMIRMPTGTGKTVVIATLAQQDRQKDLWNRFLEYERNVRERTKAGHAELSAFDEFIASHANAPSFCLLGDFRRHLRADEISNPRKVIQMRKTAIELFDEPLDAEDISAAMTSLLHYLTEPLHTARTRAYTFKLRCYE